MRHSIFGGVVGLVLLALPVTSFAASADTYRQLDLFGDVFEKVRSDYVEEIDDAELIKAAISGMLTSLDPHSKFLNPKNYDEIRIQTRGKFGGLGIEVTMENGFVKVISPIDDTPAQRAGLMPGDFVTHIDDEPVFGLSLEESVDRMRGEVDSAIKLTIQRPGKETPFDVDIVRAVIKIRSVRTRMEGDDVVYARITSFSEATTTDLERGVEKLRETHGDSLVGVVLDLRNNPGGLLDQAIAVSDAFLPKGEIVSTRGRRSDSIQRFNARGGDITDGLPVVILINGGSASASEIVAGALQDHRRAVVLGTRSFGKGSVQTVIPLGSNGAIRLTTARYYTPSGRSIQAKGIDPDIIVEPARLEKLEQGRRRRESDLRGSLDAEENAGNATPDDLAVDEKDKANVDYQLARALDLLRGFRLLSSTTTAD